MQVLMACSDETEAQESQYAHLLAEEQNLTDELEQLNERKKNMQLINDQTSGWLKRVGAKMQDQLQGMRIQSEDRNVVDVLREIAMLAKAQLHTIKQRQQADEEDSVGDKDYMGDFVSEEYITKNIRVMPMGGLSIDNQSEHTSKYYASGMGATAADSDFEDSKYNRDEYHELLTKRALVKEKRLEAERKAIEDAEREAKAKQKLIR
jgi:hypothetical protein